MELEYYTLDQAARRLDCQPDDLLHQIENKRLFPCVYVKSRKLIIIEVEGNKRVARGSCFYTGLLELDESTIQKLLESPETNAKGVHRLLEPHKIHSWNPNCCYRSEYYKQNRDIQEWIPGDFESFRNGVCQQ